MVTENEKLKQDIENKNLRHSLILDLINGKRNRGFQYAFEKEK